MSKKRSRRKAKAERLNLRLWADGCREAILAPHVAPYADAKARGWTAQRDYLDGVYTQFHTLINWRLKDHEEPSTPLPPYDPDAIPVQEVLTLEESIQKLRRIKELNSRIRRWFEYRVRQLHKLFSPKLNPRKNPYSSLLAKLSGVHQPPKARQAYQQFMAEEYSARIAPVVDERWELEIKMNNLRPGSLPPVPFRAKVARDLFNRLPSTEQIGYKTRAQALAQEAKDEYEREMTAPPKLDPESIQKCVDNIPQFLGPIIRGVQERTRYKFLILYGGPCPRVNGQVTGAYISYGSNRANNPVSFPDWKQGKFADGTWPAFKEWLTTCYADEEIQAASLGSLQPKQPGDDDDDFDEDHSSEEEGSSLEESDEADDEPLMSRISNPPLLKSRKSNRSSNNPAAATSALPAKPTPQPPKKRIRLESQTAAASSAPLSNPASALPAKSAPQPPKKRVRLESQMESASSALPSNAAAQLRRGQSKSANRRVTAPAGFMAANSPITPPTPTTSASSIAATATAAPALAAPVMSTTISTTPAHSGTAAIATPAAGAVSITSMSVSTTSVSTTPAVSATVTNPITPGGPAAAATSTVVPLSTNPVSQTNTSSTPPSPIPVGAGVAADATRSDSARVPESTSQPESQRAIEEESNASSTAPVENSLPSPEQPTPMDVDPPPVTQPTAFTTSPLSTPVTPSPSSTPITPSPSSTPMTPSPLLSPNANGSTLINSGTISTPTCPSTVAQWFQEAFAVITPQPLGPDYSDLLQTYIAIEAAHNYQNPIRGLPTRLRPDELKRWIAGGRWRIRSPVVRDPLRFGTQWWAWYLTHQPRWRKVSNGRPLVVEYGSEWDSLLFPGQNGILSIIAPLCWWGCAVFEQRHTLPDPYSAWQEAVRDATWLFRGLQIHLG